MTNFKKFELERALLQIATFNPETKEMVSGLLSENITLGTKRKLQKIHKKLEVAYLELIEDIKKVQEVCSEDKEKLNKEIQELLNEDVSLEFEPIQYSQIENVSTSHIYNFEIIDKFAI